MINFGTSAYAKLLALNPKPRDSEIRKRLHASGSGYDFHKAMRRIAGAFLSGRASEEETIIALEKISKPAERKAAKLAINALRKWLDGQPVDLSMIQEKRVYSPNELFSVRFSPDLAIWIKGEPVQIHIWNTARPNLKMREAFGVTGLFSDEYETQKIGILSLRGPELFVMKERGSAAHLAKLLAIDVENRIRKVQDDETSRASRDDVRTAERDAGRAGQKE